MHGLNERWRTEMAVFMDEEFLLNTPQASKLYHEFAKALPIIDFHTQFL